MKDVLAFFRRGSPSLSVGDTDRSLEPDIMKNDIDIEVVAGRQKLLAKSATGMICTCLLSPQKNYISNMCQEEQIQFCIL